jgi:hypothetical protein
MRRHLIARWLCMRIADLAGGSVIYSPAIAFTQQGVRFVHGAGFHRCHFAGSWPTILDRAAFDEATVVRGAF